MSMLKQEILVTGASGFIGRRVVQRLEEAGKTVHRFAGSTGQDVTDPNSFEAFRGAGIGNVIHLAARTFVPESWRDPSSFYRVNTFGTQQVLDFCREAGCRLVYVSAYLYGIPQALPIPESHPVSPNNPYAHSKWLAEDLCRFYAREYGVPVTILRPFNIFGPGQDPQFLVPSILKQAREEALITVKDAAPRRDYLHVDDLVRACVQALQLDTPLSVFNAGSGHSFSVQELLEMVCRWSPRPLQWRSTGEVRVNEIPDTVADITAIRAALGWSPEIALEDFIRSELT